VAYPPIGKRTTTSIDHTRVDSSKRRTTSQTESSIWLRRSSDDEYSADSSTNITEPHERPGVGRGAVATGSGTGHHVWMPSRWGGQSLSRT